MIGHGKKEGGGEVIRYIKFWLPAISQGCPGYLVDDGSKGEDVGIAQEVFGGPIEAVRRSTLFAPFPPRQNPPTTISYNQWFSPSFHLPRALWSIIFTILPFSPFLPAFPASFLSRFAFSETPLFSTNTFVAIMNSFLAVILIFFRGQTDVFTGK